tara:strand:+ start:4645 stop:4875 length:231 start_codon:yes stop_codon:yes gene_type:complete
MSALYLLYINFTFLKLVRGWCLEEGRVARDALSRALLRLHRIHDGWSLLLKKLAEGVIILEADAVGFHDVIIQKLR